jgi:NADH:ubiquinone oxidoreductase subunit 4 (subunit M)
VFFGPLREPHVGHEPVTDLNLREFAALAPILILCVVLGVFPQPAIDTAKPDLDVVANILRARSVSEGPAAPNLADASGSDEDH